MKRKTTVQLELHPFCGFWTFDNLPHHVRARREIVLKNRFASTSHIGQNSLPMMPAKKFISRSFRTVEQSLINICASNAF